MNKEGLEKTKEGFDEIVAEINEWEKNLRTTEEEFDEIPVEHLLMAVNLSDRVIGFLSEFKVKANAHILNRNMDA